jgi:hypothetical protein
MRRAANGIYALADYTVDPCTSPAIARGFLSTRTSADAPHNACDGREYNQTPLGDW